MIDQEKPDRPERSVDEVTEFRDWSTQSDSMGLNLQTYQYPLFIGLAWILVKVFSINRWLPPSPISWLPPILLIILGILLWADQIFKFHIGQRLIGAVDDLHRKQFPSEIPLQVDLDSREAYFAYLGVRIESSPQALQFNLRWYRGERLASQIFLAILAWMGIFLLAGIQPGLRECLVYFKIIGGILLAVTGTGLFYGALLTWINHTQLLVTQSEISLRHRPLPYLRDKNLPINMIDELMSEREQHISVEGIHTINFKLIASLKNGLETILVRYPDEVVLNYIKRKIESWLKLYD